ncbi:ribonuclease HII [Nakamurella leprariae]|uniref:ribonuclease HII n=1 Tax=Nakamurella leprariae TaxID=2803911 RepID=UPI002E2C1648|nr:ribonuclease HII [Nakamurella leprariae]
MEKSLLRDGALRLAAMDEVGRGALAGPVSVGVVVVTAAIGRVPPGLKDSKLLPPPARQALVAPVRRWAGEYAVGHASAAEIDAWGIIPALRAAARRALAGLAGPVDAVLLDGNFDYLTEPPTLVGFGPEYPQPPGTTPSVGELPVHVRIKADMTCAGVAGASVLAKTERDAMLVDLDPLHPRYGFAENKGYGTPEHVAALRRHGPSEVHRRSWRLPVDQVSPAVAFGVQDEDDIVGTGTSQEWAS